MRYGCAFAWAFGRKEENRTIFGVDELNRLKTVQSQATSGADCWGQSFTYDRYANMTGIAVTQCSAPTLSLGINTANNRVTNAGYTYDSGGNVLTDGANTYTWNAEGRMTSAAGVNYTYDADNRRVKKSNSKLYWYGLGGEVLAESDLTGAITAEYIYFNGQRIARKAPSSSNVYYYLADRLGTARVIVSVNINGTVNTPAIVAESDNYPYGGERVVTADSTNNTYKFTGHERDSETGLDHTLHRQYAPNTGRWESPDPLTGNPVNPQSWNRYSYAANSPCNLIDRDGGFVEQPGPPPGGDPLFELFLHGLNPGPGSPANPIDPNDLRGARVGKGFADLKTAGFKKGCGDVFNAVGTSADAVHAGAADANVHYATDGSSAFGDSLQSLYTNAASEENQAKIFTGTVADGFRVGGAGTIAMSQLGGNNIYINNTTPVVDKFSANDFESMAFHEILHNITGRDDKEIQTMFATAGLISKREVGSRDTKKTIADVIKKKCF